METLTVKRSEHGKDVLWVERLQCGCIMGHYFMQLHNVEPQVLNYKYGPCMLALQLEIEIHPELRVGTVVSTNDNYNGANRETLLKKEFAKANIQLEFVD